MVFMRSLLKRYRVPKIHKEGAIIIMIAFAITLACFYNSDFLGYISLLFTCFTTYFFRDPDRVTPQDADVVVSPADGVVQSISKELPPQELQMEENLMQRVSIFLNVFNVHVNRVPAKGTIDKEHYVAGKFINASLDKASIYNERQLISMTTENNTKIAFSQIAGLIARRIICNLKAGDSVEAGEKFGIIRFGSRMDVFLPLEVKLNVLEGQTMIGGETVIAYLSQNHTSL